MRDEGGLLPLPTENNSHRYHVVRVHYSVWPRWVYPYFITIIPTMIVTRFIRDRTVPGG